MMDMLNRRHRRKLILGPAAAGIIRQLALHIPGAVGIRTRVRSIFDAVHVLLFPVDFRKDLPQVADLADIPVAASGVLRDIRENLGIRIRCAHDIYGDIVGICLIDDLVGRVIACIVRAVGKHNNQLCAGSGRGVMHAFQRRVIERGFSIGCHTVNAIQQQVRIVGVGAHIHHGVLKGNQLRLVAVGVIQAVHEALHDLPHLGHALLHTPGLIRNNVDAYALVSLQALDPADLPLDILPAADGFPDPGRG